MEGVSFPDFEAQSGISTTHRQVAKALIKRFKDEQSEEDLLKALGKIKQKKASVYQFVENIKDMVRQLASPPSNKILQA